MLRRTSSVVSSSCVYVLLALLVVSVGAFDFSSCFASSPVAAACPDPQRAWVLDPGLTGLFSDQFALNMYQMQCRGPITRSGVWLLPYSSPSSWNIGAGVMGVDIATGAVVFNATLADGGDVYLPRLSVDENFFVTTVFENLTAVDLMGNILWTRHVTSQLRLCGFAQEVVLGLTEKHIVSANYSSDAFGCRGHPYNILLRNVFDGSVAESTDFDLIPANSSSDSCALLSPDGRFVIVASANTLIVLSTLSLTVVNRRHFDMFSTVINRTLINFVLNDDASLLIVKSLTAVHPGWSFWGSIATGIAGGNSDFGPFLPPLGTGFSNTFLSVNSFFQWNSSLSSTNITAIALSSGLKIWTAGVLPLEHGFSTPGRISSYSIGGGSSSRLAYAMYSGRGLLSWDSTTGNGFALVSNGFAPNSFRESVLLAGATDGNTTCLCYAMYSGFLTCRKSQ